MIKGLFLNMLVVTTVVLTGCSTPPPPPPEPIPAPEPVPAEVPAAPVQPTLLDEMQTLSAATIEAGGLASIGIAESKSLDLAIKLAEKNSRIELARQLTLRIETMSHAFSEETGTPYDAPLLSGFKTVTDVIIQHQIVGSAAQIMKYEASDDAAFTAYAFIELNPQLIADQLAQETELYARLQPTQAFQTFSEEIKTYDAFKSAQK